MVQIIEHIDAIARQKNRDVVFLQFHKDLSPEVWESWQEETHPRQRIIAWLDENNIAWKKCSHVADENGFMAYLGQIYIDVPLDINDANYKRVVDYIEDGEGNVKTAFPNTYFYYLPLETALKNAHHDLPGFWEKWAENF